MTTSTRFTREKAPCGKTVDGEHVRDDDPDGGFLIDQMRYDCGCRSTRQQYHDGSVHFRVVDHHGKVRCDEQSPMHEG
ncbi:MAG: hypothetical protein ACRDWY_09370 [Actinomycetes bacterium]